MAITHFINRPKSQDRRGMAAVLKYVRLDRKTMLDDGTKLVSGVNCVADSAWREFMQTKLLYRKDSKVMFYHAVLSFSPEEKVSHQRAHEFALQYAAEQFPGFQVVVATHRDKDHVHSHLVINSVNMDTGRKLHMGSKDMERLMQATDDLCLQYGLSVCKPTETDVRVKQMSDAEYRIAAKGESWKMALDCDIVECMKLARNRKEFVDLMEAEGYKVKWTDSRKNITYTLPSGKKCRDDRLHHTRYLKEEMEREFRIRADEVARSIAHEEYAEQYDRQQGGEPSRGDRAELASTGIDGEGFHAGDRTTGGAGAEAGNTGEDGGDAGRPVQWDLRPAESADGEQHAMPERSAQGERQTADRATQTGWEAEREQFYMAQYNRSMAEENAVAMDSVFAAVGAEYGTAVPVVAEPSVNTGDVGGALIELGRAMEGLQSNAPVQDATTMPKEKMDKKRRQEMHEQGLL